MHYLGKITLLAIAYYVSGRLGLLLAVPPGYATAMWPPSGLALAALLLLGYRFWPGVLLGSFAVNLFTSFNPRDMSTILMSGGIAAVISLGATLQSLAGAWLVRRYVAFPTTLERARDIGLLLLLGGPASCLINSLVGVCILTAAGAIEPDKSPFNWLTWWVGDTIGVVVFTPILLVLFTPHSAVSARRKVIISGTLVGIFMLTISTFLAASSWEHERQRNLFEMQASAMSSRLEEKISQYRSTLHAIAAFFAASQTVERDEFRTFVTPLFSRLPGILALSWNARITDAERKHHEASMRSAGFPDFSIRDAAEGTMKPAARRDTYFPVTFIEPHAANAAAQGFDTYSEPARRAAMDSARDEGRAWSTGRIQLVQEGGVKPGLLLFRPIYRNGLPHETLEERRQNLLGYVAGAFLIPDMLEIDEKTLQSNGLRLTIEDVSVPEGTHMLYDSGVAGKTSAAKTAPLTWISRLPVAGREWKLTFTQNPEYTATHQSWNVWLVLAGGLIFTGLAGAFLLVVTGRTDSMEREVARRIAAEESLRRYARDLEHSNQDLEEFAHIASHDLKEPLRGLHNQATFLVRDYAAQLNDKGVHRLRRLMYLSELMERLVSDLLHFSQLGRAELAVRQADPGAMIDEIRFSLESFLKEQNARIVVPQPLPPVICDKVRMTEVFRNLIINAVKYNDKPDKIIEIGFFPSLETSRGLKVGVFYVKDNGIGIEPEFHEEIFRIFKRLQPPPTEKVEGTGAGLTFVKKIIERHGGEIWLESTPGKGTTFYFTLNNGGHRHE